MMHHLSSAGVNVNEKYQGYDRKPVTDMFSFFKMLMSGWMTNSTKAFLKVGNNCVFMEFMCVLGKCSLKLD